MDDSERKEALAELKNMRKLVVGLIGHLEFSESHSQFLDRLDLLIARLEDRE